MKSIKLVVAVAVSLLLAFPMSVLADVVGTVTCIEGRVDRLDIEGDKYLPLVVGEDISVGDAIRTKSFSKMEISFEDNSVVQLGDSSQIRIKDYTVGDDGYRKSSAIDLDRGKIRAIVSKTPELTPFDINTPNASGFVKGSDIFVSFLQSSTNVLVTEGTFTMANPTFPDDRIDVNPGMTSLVPYNAPPKDPRAFLPSEKAKYEDAISPIVKKTEGVTEKHFTKATVSKTSGEVRVQSKGTKEWKVVTKDVVLNVGDRVETGKTGNIQIVFDNGLIIELRPNTQLIIVKLNRNPKTGDYESIFESKYGKLIAKLQNKPATSTFQVKTPHAVCGIRGTIMYLDILPNATRSFFEGGEGFVADAATGTARIIQLGTTATTDGQGNTTESETTDEERSGFGSGFGSEGGDEYGYSGGGGGDPAGDPDPDPAPAPDPAPVDPDPSGGDDPTGGDVGDNITNDIIVDLTNQEQIVPVVINDENTGPVDVRADYNGTYGCYGSFAADPESWVRGVISGSTSGAPWMGIYPAAFAGEYFNPNGLDLFWGELEGEGSDGGSIYGRMVGASGDAHGTETVLASLYVDPSNTTGWIFNGNDTSDVFFIPVTESPVPAENLLDSINESDVETELWFDFYRDEGYFEGECEVNQISIDRENWGIWEGIFSAWYDNPEGIENWTGVNIDEAFGSWQYGLLMERRVLSARVMDFDGFGEGYSITVVEGIDDLEGFLRMDVMGMYLDSYSLNTMYGTIVGTYEARDGYYFEGVGAGGWSQSPLAWSAEVDAYYHYLDYGEITSDDCEYVHAGLAGAVTSPFVSPGTPVAITLMGETEPYGYISWWGYVSENEMSDGSVLPDGFIGGRTNSCEGMLASLYIDGDGHAGTLWGNFDGEYYENFDMWMATGSMTATQRTVGYDPGSYDTDVYYMDGDIYGDFNDTGGEIYSDYGIYGVAYGELGAYTAWLINPETGDAEPWGIYNIELGGYFDYPDTSDDWTLYLGCDNGEWRDLDPDERWFATVEGSQWSDQRIAGTLYGRYMTSRVLGTISGEVLGSYDTEDYESWEAIALGVFTEEPLSHRGKIEDGEFYAFTFDGRMEFGLNPEPIGDMNGVMGGVGSLWSGADDVTLLGSSQLYDSLSSCVWRAPVYSRNDGRITYTTYDGGAYYGFLLGSQRETEIEGVMRALYLGPPDEDGNMDVGFVSGDFSGVNAPDLDMFWMEGSLETNSMGVFTEMPGISSPEDLYFYFSENDEESFLAGVGVCLGDPEGESGNVAFGLITGDSLSFDDLGWGIWESTFMGSFVGIDPVPAWDMPLTGVISNLGFNEFDQTYGRTYFTGEIQSTEWLMDGRLAGDFDGVWLSIDRYLDDGVPLLSWGTMSGDVVGSNEYIEAGEEFVGTWQAAGAGEWVEVDQLLDLTDLTSQIEGLAEFDVFSIPITEVLQGIGSGGITDAVMDLAMYGADSALTGIWAAIISGTYTPGAVEAGSWGVDFATGDGSSVDLNGMQWSDNQWTASVEGSVAGRVLDGTAVGTYDDVGNFSGAGAGMWIDESISEMTEGFPGNANMRQPT